MDYRETKKEIAKREELLLDFLDDPTSNNENRYKKFKNFNLSNQRKSERNYYKEQFELFESDLRKSWKVIKKIIRKEDSRKSNQQIDFAINNKLVSDSITIANSFNNYFINVGPSLAKHIQCDVNPLTYVNTNIYSMFLPTILEEEITLVIKSLKNSSPGYDEIPAMMMKKCVESYIQPLTHLINLSFTMGIFPNELKLAKIIPIYKGEDAQLIQNYRPISVLPFFPKYLKK